MQRPTVSSASSSLTSATQTFASSSVNSCAASRPMPPPAPVITQTLPSSLAISALRRDEHVLDLRVALERMHAELPAEAGLLEAAEGRRDANRAVRVHGEDAGVDRSCDAQRPGAVAGPDRAREAVRRVVRLPDRVRL